MRGYVSKLIETNNLIIKEATMDECEGLQNICDTWEEKELVEGDSFEENYILKHLTEGDLPPIEDAKRESYCLKSIYSKEHCRIIGFIEIYHGYPKPDIFWISMFVLDKQFNSRGFGQEIIEALSMDLTETIYCRMGLAVYLKNWKGLRFWTKAGFDKVIGIYGDKIYTQNAFALIGLEKILE